MKGGGNGRHRSIDASNITNPNCSVDSSNRLPVSRSTAPLISSVQIQPPQPQQTFDYVHSIGRTYTSSNRLKRYQVSQYHVNCFPTALLVQWAHRGYHHDLLTEFRTWGHRTKRLLILRRTHVRIEAGRRTPRDQRGREKANEIGQAHEHRGG